MCRAYNKHPGDVSYYFLTTSYSLTPQSLPSAVYFLTQAIWILQWPTNSQPQSLLLHTLYDWVRFSMFGLHPPLGPSLHCIILVFLYLSGPLYSFMGILPLSWKFRQPWLFFSFFLYTDPSTVASFLATDTNLFESYKGQPNFPSDYWSHSLSTRMSSWSLALKISVTEYVVIPTNHPSSWKCISIQNSTVLPYQVLNLHCFGVLFSLTSTPLKLITCPSLVPSSVVFIFFLFSPLCSPLAEGLITLDLRAKMAQLALNLHYFTLGVPYTWLTQNFFNLLFIMKNFKHTEWYS